jgi:hypothetical protein
MSLKRSLLAMLLMLGLMAGSIATAVAGGAPAVTPVAAAQQADDDDDATPERDVEEATARPDDEDEADDDADAATGDAADVVDNVTVEVVDERGNPSVAITVNETNDEWEDYSEFSTPDRGFRFVALVVTVENVSDDLIEVSDFDFFIRDEQGFIYGTSFASIDEESESAEIGEFERTELAAGDSYTGIMIFGVPNEAEIVDAFYAPSGRLITIATLGGEVLAED